MDEIKIQADDALEVPFSFKELRETVKLYLQELGLFLRPLMVALLFFAITFALLWGISYLWLPSLIAVDLRPIFIATVIVLAGADLGFRHIAPQTYLRSGICILRRIHYVGHQPELESEFGKISGSLSSVALFPRVDIEKVTQDTYRLRLFKAVVVSSYRGRHQREVHDPKTYGYLYWDKKRHSVRLDVYLRWPSILFVLFWLALPFDGMFKFIPIAIALFPFLHLDREFTQHIRVWEVVSRFAEGEYGVYRISTELLKIARAHRREMRNGNG